MFQTQSSNRASALGLLILCGALAAGAPSQTVYVNQGATGANTGTSWADAFTNLQSALSTTVPATQIWVAAGTYKPGTTQAATFQLRPSVGMYGGFAGGETFLSQRNIHDHKTILSGDLDGNDGTGFGTGTNSFVVVNSGSTNTATTVLDGFIITGGLANGGGLHTNFGDRKIRNCVFYKNGGNIPPKGGAVTVNNGLCDFVDCAFINNRAQKGGAADLTDCIVNLVNCKFEGNEAGLIAGADGVGGAVTASDSGGTANVHMINCAFVGNIAAANGGAVDRSCSYLSIINSTFRDNQSLVVGGAGGVRTASTGIGSSQTFMRNCILWGNTDVSGASGVGNQFSPTVLTDISKSCIQGFTGGFGTGNTGADPKLVTVVGGDPDLFGAPNHARIGFGSSCIDKGDNLQVPADTFDVDADGNITELVPDIELQVRSFDGDTVPGAVVDMGAHEFEGCQTNLGFAGPGNFRITLCGQDLVHAGNTATLSFSGALSTDTVWLIVGIAPNPQPSFQQGMSYIFPTADQIYVVPGSFTTTISGTNNPPVTIYMQALITSSPYPKPVSNAIQVEVGT